MTWPQADSCTWRLRKACGCEAAGMAPPLAPMSQSLHSPNRMQTISDPRLLGREFNDAFFLVEHDNARPSGDDRGLRWHLGRGHPEEDDVGRLGRQRADVDVRQHPAHVAVITYERPPGVG